MSGVDRATTTPIELSAKPVGPPIACTLEAGDVPARLAQWRALLAGARARTRLADGVMRIDFGPAYDLAELTRLVAAEHACCAFLSFMVTISVDGLSLEVSAPPEAAVIVDDLFGS